MGQYKEMRLIMTRKQKNILKLMFIAQLVIFLIGIIILSTHNRAFAPIVFPFCIVENIYAHKLDKEIFLKR